MTANVLTMEEFKTQFTVYVKANTTQFCIDDAEDYQWEAYYQGYLDGYSFEHILDYGIDGMVSEERVVSLADRRLREILDSVQVLEEIGGCDSRTEYISILEKVKSDIEVRIANARAILASEGEG